MEIINTMTQLNQLKNAFFPITTDTILCGINGMSIEAILIRHTTGATEYEYWTSADREAINRILGLKTETCEKQNFTKECDKV